MEVSEPRLCFDFPERWGIEDVSKMSSHGQNERSTIEGIVMQSHPRNVIDVNTTEEVRRKKSVSNKRT